MSDPTFEMRRAMRRSLQVGRLANIGMSMVVAGACAAMAWLCRDRWFTCVFDLFLVAMNLTTCRKALRGRRQYKEREMQYDGIS